MSDRIYSEEEVAKVIRRAVEMDTNGTGSGQAGTRNGLTMRDLEQIAADAGIDPELMQKAARELDAPKLPENFEESTKVTRQEIVAEHWIKLPVNQQLYDDLITELNHRFGTSQDDISWWNNLFNDYSGKAVVSKTRKSADWRYTDEMELYTTRVLLQKRGDKLRIRVGKRIGWSLTWKSKSTAISIGVLSALLFSIVGGSFSFAFLDTPLPGIMTGIGLSALITALSLAYLRRKLKQHKKEVSDIAESLVTQAKRFSEELFGSKSTSATSESGNPSNLGEIEIEVDSKASSSTNSGESRSLKNHLRG